MDTPEGLFRGVVETVPMAVAVLDGAGDIVFTNDRWRTFARENGYVGDPSSIDESYLDVLADAPDEPQSDAIHAAITAVVDGDDSVHQFEYPCHSPDVPRWFLLSVVGLDVDGDRYVHLGHLDITARKLAELEVRDRNERLRTVTRVLSHDLRNPLNVASAYLELLADSGELSTVADIRAALSRMAAILDDSLVLASGTDADELETTSLERVATEAWAYVETGDATLVVEDDQSFIADGSLLANLLENLFRNAVEHGSTGPPSQTREDAVEHGSTSPRSTSSREDAVEHGSGDGGVTVRVGPLETAAGFYVEDDGPGVPAAIADRVFEPGFTTGEENTGFGLAIVDTVAAAHGWTVALTDAAGGGARFEFGGVAVLSDGAATDAGADDRASGNGEADEV